MLLLLMVFIIPVVLAKLALENGWFTEAATNRGTLLREELSLQSLNLSDAALQKKWLVMYQVSNTCEQTCQQSLYGINQAFTSLGREIERVVPVGLYTSELNEQALGGLKGKYWHFSQITNEARSRLKPSQVYVADPLGNIILQYPEPKTDQEVLDFGKAMLSDLRKLLKYSRIG